MKFYIGLHHPGDAKHFPGACLSIRYLRRRRKPIDCADILVDSGAFTELSLHGGYNQGAEVYADELRRLHEEGVVQITAAVAQDYMCEPIMLAKTGLTIADHQRLTIQRYDALMFELPPVPIMPVLQGYAPEDYVRHIADYGSRLRFGMWVGVGSVCKRNGDPSKIVAVLSAIHAARPDLRLHGFGIKRTSLANADVRRLLHSSDSMAWSYHARINGRGGDANKWQEAKKFADEIHAVLR